MRCKTTGLYHSKPACVACDMYNTRCRSRSRYVSPLISVLSQYQHTFTLFSGPHQGSVDIAIAPLPRPPPPRPPPPCTSTHHGTCVHTPTTRQLLHHHILTKHGFVTHSNRLRYGSGIVVCILPSFFSLCVVPLYMINLCQSLVVNIDTSYI